MDLGEHIKELELKGFTVFPELLTAEEVRSLKQSLRAVPLQPVDYSEAQRVHHNFHLLGYSPALELIGNPVIESFLLQLFGDELICTSTLYAESHPGHPGIALHTDAQPYGSLIFGMQASAPVLVRVLYYLDDLTYDKSPLRVIPYSHLSLHAHANPYRRYEHHPDEEIVTCKSGTAVIINQKVFHGSLPNVCGKARSLVAFAFRPAWAGPIDKVAEWEAENLQKLPNHIKKYFRSLNNRNINFNVKNRPNNLKKKATGLNLSRWE